jgi:hypothetical protein
MRLLLWAIRAAQGTEFPVHLAIGSPSQSNLTAQPTCQLLVLASHARKIGRLDEFPQQSGLQNGGPLLSGGQSFDDPTPGLPSRGLNADGAELQNDLTVAQGMRDIALIVAGHGPNG